MEVLRPGCYADSSLLFDQNFIYGGVWKRSYEMILHPQYHRRPKLLWKQPSTCITQQCYFLEFVWEYKDRTEQFKIWRKIIKSTYLFLLYAQHMEFMSFRGVSERFQRVLASLHLEEGPSRIIYGEANTRQDHSETPPNAIKHMLLIQQEKVSRCYYFSPYFELFCTIVIFPYKLL